MLKSFLLLRNNQQSGPFTQEELLRLPLKPNDLIWIIGQSAGWRFPEELNLLEVPGQQQAVVPEPIPVVKTNTASIPAIILISEKDKEVGYIYVSMPAKVTHQADSNPITEETIPSFEERVEKMRQRVAAVNTSVKTKEEPAIDTKYSRSLEDIKDEYSSWLREQKKKQRTRIEAKHVGIAVLLLVTISGSFWAAQHIFSRPVLQAHTPKAVMPLVTATPISTSLVSTTPLNTGAQPKRYAPLTQQPIETVKRKPSMQNRIQSNIQVSNADERRMEHSVHKTVVSPTVVKENTPSIATEQAVPMGDQIDLKSEILPSQKQKGMSGMTVTVKNNSKQAMKVIAVDVVYYADGMKEMDRKTLYFSNVAPGEALTLQAPAHKKAEGAYAQLGLISSEGGSIFYAVND